MLPNMNNGNYLPLMKKRPLWYQGIWLFGAYQEVLEVLSIFKSFENKKKCGCYYTWWMSHEFTGSSIEELHTKEKSQFREKYALLFCSSFSYWQILTELQTEEVTCFISPDFFLWTRV